MAEKNYGYHQEYDALMAHVAGLGRGELLTYEAIREKTGLVKEDAAFARLVARVKDATFASREIVIGRATANVGYKLLTENEQFDWGERQDRRSTQLLRRGAAAVAVIAPERLSDDRRVKQKSIVAGGGTATRITGDLI